MSKPFWWAEGWADATDILRRRRIGARFPATNEELSAIAQGCGVVPTICPAPDPAQSTFGLAPHGAKMGNGCYWVHGRRGGS